MKTWTSSRLLWGLMIVFAAGLVAQERRPSSHRQSDGRKRQAKYREGSKIVKQLGQFRTDNGSVEFHFKDDKRVFRVLENLALERVLGELANNSQPPQWSVSGTMTEFQGSNFLLVRRAILKAKQ